MIIDKTANLSTFGIAPSRPNDLTGAYSSFKSDADARRVAQDDVLRGGVQVAGDFDDINRPGNARGKGPGLLLDIFKFWNGLNGANDSTRAWDKAAETVKRHRGSLAPGEGFEVILTERNGQRHLSVTKMDQSKAGGGQAYPEGTKTLRRIWVGDTHPRQLGPRSGVEVMSPDNFVRLFDRVR